MLFSITKVRVFVDFNKFFCLNSYDFLDYRLIFSNIMSETSFLSTNRVLFFLV